MPKLLDAPSIELGVAFNTEAIAAAVAAAASASDVRVNGGGDTCGACNDDCGCSGGGGGGGDRFSADGAAQCAGGRLDAAAEAASRIG